MLRRNCGTLVRRIAMRISQTFAIISLISITSTIANAALFGPVSADLICKYTGNRLLVVSGQYSTFDYSVATPNLQTVNIAQKYNKKSTDDLSLLGIPCTEGQAWLIGMSSMSCATSMVSGSGNIEDLVLFIQTLSNQNAVNIGGGLVSYHYSGICGDPASE